METTLTKIGNSKGVIIPAGFLKECQLENAVSLTIQDGAIMITKPAHPREGWAEAFAKVAPCHSEMLIDDSIQNEFDEKEWVW